MRALLRHIVLALGLSALIVPGYASAQSYPNKPIHYVVTDQPGSNIDTLARIIAEKLRVVLKQAVVVENRAGAGGNIGAQVGAKAAPDGYTIVQLATTHAVNVSLYKDLQYNLLRDFAPVTLLASSPSVVVVPSANPDKSIKDLIDTAKAKPDTVFYASAGVGTCTFLAAEQFKKRTGVDMRHIPYKGGGPAVVSILSGESHVYFAPVPPVLAHIRNGALRALAVTTTKPMELLPNVPPVADAGVPGYEFSCWYGLFMPAGTPKPMIDTMYDAILQVLNDEGVKQRLMELGFVPGGNRPDAFAEYVKAEVESARELVRDIPPF
jgi:tripartite-type tricarboxylate transporter receptor subunit TctC